ncbi:putative protein S-acyltransferase [Helianthus annuus]|nr:putative protein S-acyltransferase [Helianthus annuus]
MFVHLTKRTKFLVRVRLFNKRTNTNEPPAERFTNCSPNFWFVCSPCCMYEVSMMHSSIRVFFQSGRCVLKMDHHCVWVVNCVGALNYKYFLLFLFYTLLETTLVTISLLPYFLAFFSDGEIAGSPSTLATTFLAFVLNLAFALSVFGFLIMHATLVSGNTTTIEAYEKKTSPKWRYDLGRKRNFEQVFGTVERYWFIPAYSEEDLRRMPALQGLEYPSKPDLDSEES